MGARCFWILLCSFFPHIFLTCDCLQLKLPLTSQMIHHRGGNPERAMHSWLKRVMAHKPCMDNSRICHRLLFRHKHGKQYFMQPLLQSIKLVRLHTRFNWTSHWSYGLNFSHLWVSIMHVLTWSELNYCHDLYCLWAAFLCWSWPSVVMCTLTWVIFVPRALRRRCALAVALHRHDIAGHIALRSVLVKYLNALI